MDLSIIIVNYNGKKFLSDCLNSIEKQCQGFDYEIIIWDNASSDGSIPFLKQNYDNKITLFPSDKNLGFAGGNNAAAQHASGKYLLLLNNDTILLNPLKPALDLIKKDSQIGVLGVKMLNGNRKYTISCGLFPKAHQFIYFKTFSLIDGELTSGAFISNQPIEVDWLSGSFLITPKFLWEEIGGLDESYFMYVEDVDYNKEVKNKGFKRVFLPSIEYIHFIGFNNTKNKLLIKGYYIYIKKHFKGINKIIALTCLSINMMIKKLKKNYK